MKDVDRNMGNFHRVSIWHTTMNQKQINYMFERYDSTVICNGRLREIKVDKITNNWFKVYTKAI